MNNSLKIKRTIKYQPGSLRVPGLWRGTKQSQNNLCKKNEIAASSHHVRLLAMAFIGHICFTSLINSLKIKLKTVKLRIGSSACSSGKAVAKMYWIKRLILSIVVLGFASQSNAYEYWDQDNNSPEIEVWTNKGNNSTYYYGEDIAVYFRVERDCYVVVYDIDPSGEVTVLYPTGPYGSTYATADRVYRVPDYEDEFGLEVSSVSGPDHIYAFASFDYINPPDFMRYIGYDYGDPNYYNDDYFVMTVHGDIGDFVNYVNDRLAVGPFSIAHAQFRVDSNYRHHRQYRYWANDPYNVGSVWIGCNFPGSEIWIDGIYYGIAPVLIPSIYVGRHWVWVYYGGYPCYQRYFYVSNYQRYYVNVTIENRYKDYRSRRRSFRNWTFDEERYRNETGFKEKAVRARQKNVRVRTLPARVVRDLHERGAISPDAPIVQRMKSDSRDGSRDSYSSKKRYDNSKEKRMVRERDSKRKAKRAGSRPESVKKKSPSGNNYRILEREKVSKQKKSYGKKAKGKSTEKKSADKEYKKNKSERKSQKVKSESKKPKSSYKKSGKKSSVKSKGFSGKSVKRSKASKLDKKSSSDKGKRR